MKIRLLAFATARQALGMDEIEVELPEASCVADLIELLERRHPELGELWPRLAVAVEGELADRETTLLDGAEVALLPPVSGGAESSRTALVDDAIDLDAVLRSAADPTCGAVLLFAGNVRDSNHGRPVERITYHAYHSMAVRALERIATDLEAEPAVVRVRIVHRLGEIPVGGTSVAIAISAPHRESAYAASRQALERLKREVPIWKLEHYADGRSQWREEEPLLRPVGDLVERHQEPKP